MGDESPVTDPQEVAAEESRGPVGEPDGAPRADGDTLPEPTGSAGPTIALHEPHEATPEEPGDPADDGPEQDSADSHADPDADARSAGPDDAHGAPDDSDSRSADPEPAGPGDSEDVGAGAAAESDDRAGATPARGEKAAGATNSWSGVLPEGFRVALPGTPRLDRARVRRGAALAGRVLVLSPGTPRLPLVAVPAVAAGWAAAVGLLCAAAIVGLVTGAWNEPATAALWLAAHHAPVTTDAGPVSLLPLGLMLLTVLPLRRAGRFLAAQLSDRPGSAEVTRNRLAVACGLAVVGYVAVAVVLASTIRQLPGVTPLSAALWAAAVAGAAGAWGVVRQARGHLPVPPVVSAVAVAVAVPLLLGGLLMITVLVAGAGDIVAAQQNLAAGWQDQVGLTLVQIAYLPNLVVWGASFVIGTGFTLGADHRLSPFAGSPAVTPDLPLLTALPVGAPNTTALLPIAVALGGALGAVVFARRLPEHLLRRRIARAVVVAGSAAVVWWVLAALAGGSLGAGRLEWLGPTGGTALLAGLLTLAGTMMWALLPTLASDARPVAVDLRERVSTAATAAKDVAGQRLPSGRRG